MHKTDVNTEITKKQRGRISTAKLVAPQTVKRIEVICLFGSQKLTRDGDTGLWIFSTGTTKPRQLTRRESMFINAALHAAEVQ